MFVFPGGDRVFEPGTCPVDPSDPNKDKELPGAGFRKVVIIVWKLFAW